MDGLKSRIMPSPKDPIRRGGFHFSFLGPILYPNARQLGCACKLWPGGVAPTGSALAVTPSPPHNAPGRTLPVTELVHRKVLGGCWPNCIRSRCWASTRLPVEVEVDVSPARLPKTVLVGLPEAAVKESTHRVERAMVNSGFQRPQDRVVINLAPAELPKQAASFDLPITLGILAGSGQIRSRNCLEQYAVVGELALDGTTRPTKGALSMAMAAARAARVCAGIRRARRPARPKRRWSRRSK